MNYFPKYVVSCGIKLSRKHYHTTAINYGNYYMNRSFNLSDPEGAKAFIARLSQVDRQHLQKHLERKSTDSIAPSKTVSMPSPKLTARQLFHVALFYGIPFTGFGILDNVVMILAGGYIELTVGHVLGISTLAAAAFGNTISDVSGICCAGVIETSFSKLGFSPPVLTPEQAQRLSVKLCANLGRCLFVAVGCLLGMFTLMVLPDDAKD